MASEKIYHVFCSVYEYDSYEDILDEGYLDDKYYSATVAKTAAEDLVEDGYSYVFILNVRTGRIYLPYEGATNEYIDESTLRDYMYGVH